MPNSSMLLLTLALSGFFSTVGAGANARRHARERRANARLLTQKWCISEIDKYGEDNVPYWITLCVEDSIACRSPEVTGVTHVTVSIKTGKCDFDLWKLTTCSKLCKIDLTTPGSDPSSCRPEYSHHPFWDALVAAVFVLILVNTLFV